MRTALGDHLQRLLVDQVTVLDDLDPGLQRVAHRLIGVGVHGDVGIPLLGGLHGRGEFVDAVLDRVERIEFGRDTTACHDLDGRGAVAKALTHGAFDFRRPVGDQAETSGPPVGRAEDRRMRLVVRAPIGVPARLGDRHGRGVDPWTRNDAFVDRLCEALRRPADVPDCGPAAHQHALGFPGRARRNVHPVLGCLDLRRRHRVGEMRVRLDDAGDQDAVSGVDDGRSFGTQVPADLDDHIVVDPEIAP